MAGKLLEVLRAFFRRQYLLMIGFAVIAVIIAGSVGANQPYSFLNASLGINYLLFAGMAFLLFLVVAARWSGMLNRPWDRMMGWVRKNALVLTVVLLVLLWLFVYLIPDIFIPIKPGQGGVLWKRFGGGTVTERYYREGTHVIFPWDTMYIYDLRYRQESREFEVLSFDGLLYSVEVTVRFRLKPEILGFLHKCVGPQYLETMVFPEVGAVTRLVIAQLTPDELYTSKRQTSEKDIKDKLKFEVVSCRPRVGLQGEQNDTRTNEMYGKSKYLDADDVFIRRVILPPKVAEAIQNKLAQRQEMLEYDYRIQKEEKEAVRKGIEANGIKTFQDTVKQGISQRLLQWKGIDATVELAKSNNSKIVIIGSGGGGGLPLILGPLEVPKPLGDLPKIEAGGETNVAIPGTAKMEKK